MTKQPKGRPHRGDRQGVTSKLPRSYFDKLTRICDANGETKNDYITRVLVADLDSINEADIDGQEPLPMSA